MPPEKSPSSVAAAAHACWVRALPGAAFMNSFTQLLAATTFTSAGATITVDANDTIMISGLTHDTMAASSTAFSFHA